MTKTDKRSCRDCRADISKRHFNSKCCKRCATKRVTHPRGTLTNEQEALVRKLAGTMRIKDLAKMVGASDSTLDRWAGQNDVNINWLKYSEDTVKEVTAFYSLHGRTATAKQFPDVKVRSVVERYKDFEPRQTKWSNTQIIEAARMAGLVSPTSQAKYFNRPNAHAGAIKSLWMKRFGFGQGSINGMVHWYAKELVNHRARYVRPKGESRTGELVEFRRLILWVDMEACLKPGVPEFMQDAIKTMARFQRWLHGPVNTRARILKMIRERETA